LTAPKVAQYTRLFTNAWFSIRVRVNCLRRAAWLLKILAAFLHAGVGMARSCRIAHYLAPAALLEERRCGKWPLNYKDTDVEGRIA
jgi:hypothetical protein